MAAHVLSGKGEHGFDDRHRGQMMVVTGMNRRSCSYQVEVLSVRLGPMLASGDELATAASKSLGTEIQFENISKWAHVFLVKAQHHKADSSM